MLETIITCTLVSLALNVVFWFIAARTLSGVYKRKLDIIVTTIHDGMEQRDAALAQLKAMVSRAIVQDTNFFDNALDMLDEETKDVADEREEEDQG